MLAIHWTPIGNIKKVLKNGIRKSKKGIFCFPLTGLRNLDKWWVSFFNQCGTRQRKKYNGVVFRIKKEDLPAYFGHWIGATSKDNFKKEITDIRSFGKQYREMLLWRMGEEIARSRRLNDGIYDYKSIEKLYSELASRELANNENALSKRLNSIEFMSFALEDYQIVVSNSISSDRIIKVLSQENEPRRILKQKFKL